MISEYDLFVLYGPIGIWMQHDNETGNVIDKVYYT